MPLTIAKALRLSTETFEDVVEAAIKVLVQGGIVALPTDTIYGVSTLLEHSDKLYRLKNRPQNKPLGLFVSSVEEISQYAELTIPHNLATSLLPGPVTLIFNRSPQLPSYFNTGVNNVGVRVPNTSLVQTICSRLQQPLAQTSANVSGSPLNPLKVEDFEELLAEIDLVIDGGEISQKTSLGSTIVDLTEPGVYKIIRDGMKRQRVEDDDIPSTSKAPALYHIPSDAEKGNIEKNRTLRNWKVLSTKIREALIRNHTNITASLGLFSLRELQISSRLDPKFKLMLPADFNKVSPSDLSGFDNTGNVRLWPGGEALAAYLLANPSLLSGKTVLELGMGDHDHGNDVCCHNHESGLDEEEGSPEMQEVLAAEKVINAFLYYKRLGREKAVGGFSQLRKIPTKHQRMIMEPYSNHVKEVVRLLELDSEVLKKMVTVGACSLSDETFKALKMTQLRRPDATYISKVNSTVRQIVREWSSEGEPDRMTTFGPVLDELRTRFPDIEERANIKIYVPGCGLGRLPYDLIKEGFTVTGNEYSMFMLITSCFLLNGCKEINEFTLHPYIFDKSNSWSYEDQLRPITFPDVCPTLGNTERKNEFSMCAGNFLEITQNDMDKWDSVVTAWFIDTANNLLEYIDRIYQMLKPGGVWVNVGPLTYHYEDTDGELSIELPYEEIKRIVLETGFCISNEKKIEAKYTWNQKSMLHNQYCCVFFSATKK